jgi:hypothetical protein
MFNKKVCSKCKSSNVKVIDYMGAKCIVCSSCGFDESKQYDVFPEDKKSQKAKGSYTPYKSGGFKRARK